MNFNFKTYSDTEVIIEIAVLSKLESENERLREALGFYADTSNYLMSVQDKLCRVEDRIKWSDLDNYGEFELLVKVGGKRAREALERGEG